MADEEGDGLEFFIGSNTFMERATDMKKWRQRDPLTEQSLNAASDLRQFYREQGNPGANLGEWKHVASIRGPLLKVAEIADPELLKDKKRAYAWMDDHPEVIVYDRRKHGARRGDMAVFQDGNVIV